MRRDNLNDEGLPVHFPLLRLHGACPTLRVRRPVGSQLHAAGFQPRSRLFHPVWAGTCALFTYIRS